MVMELKPKLSNRSFCAWKYIDSRCLRVLHHQDSHANAWPMIYVRNFFYIKKISFFLSDHLPKFFGSENLDDAASAINDYIYNVRKRTCRVVTL
jgi:hypothetical protein